MIRQLAYTAQARAGLAPADITALVERRRLAAAPLGITGALVYTGEQFFELIEGSAGAIERMRGALLPEPAFRSHRWLVDRTAATRWFRRWGAGYVPARSFDPWLARVEAALPAGADAAIETIRGFLEAARTF